MDISKFSLCTDIIGQAYLDGLDPVRVCARLRTALRNGEILAVGYRTVVEPGEDDCPSPSPHFQLTAIPRNFWKGMPRLVDGHLHGLWHNGRDGRIEKALHWSTSDWYGSVFRSYGPTCDWRFLIEEFSGVRLQSREAKAAIAKINGSAQPSRRGRRPGQSRYSSEQPLYREGAKMVTIDKIPRHRAAVELAPRAIVGAGHLSVVKRIERGIKREIERMR